MSAGADSCLESDDRTIHGSQLFGTQGDADGPIGMMGEHRGQHCRTDGEK